MALASKFFKKFAIKEKMVSKINYFNLFIFIFFYVLTKQSSEFEFIIKVSVHFPISQLLLSTNSWDWGSIDNFYIIP